MTRTEVINAFIKKYGYTSYCEIGVEAGINFNAIECPIKVGVDPDPTSAATLHVTSDEFFEIIAIIITPAYGSTEPLICKWNEEPFPCNMYQGFDIFWIDGLHHAEQVERDILNALKYLKPGGVILCHDMLPTSKEVQEVPRKQDVWTGDCWRAFVNLRSSPGLRMYTIDTDWGIGVISIGQGTPLIIHKARQHKMTYEQFARDKSILMNIKTVEQFKTLEGL